MSIQLDRYIRQIREAFNPKGHSYFNNDPDKDLDRARNFRGSSSDIKMLTSNHGSLENYIKTHPANKGKK